jgi:hypothetical protein
MFINLSRLVAASLVLTGLPVAASSGTHRARPQFITGVCIYNGTGAFVGGGSTNFATGMDATVVDGDQNQACDPSTAIAGGSNNAIYSGESTTASESFIGAGDSNTIDSPDAFIGAGSTNTIALSAQAGFIGAGQGGTVSAADAFIGAGSMNTASGLAAFVGAGVSNTASGASAFVGAGDTNVASGDYSAVDGGFGNKATAAYASVTGGSDNTASGNAATVVGGYHNQATGKFSFAAGYGSYANTDGSFVWSDDASGAKHLAPARANEFIARATGGVVFLTNAAATTGAMLAPGSGTWASSSDRALKSAVVPVSDGAILAKVAALPVAEWSYTSERGVRHVGPMAQDFYAAFGVGADDRHITSVDEDGVALAAIKALHAKLQLKGREVGALREMVSSQGDELRALRAELHALEARAARR